MNFAAAVAALEARQEARIELGLERVRDHLQRLGSPHEALRCVHVAGTNGKGSTCAILESVLRAAGLKTGLYTSPHLSDVRERVRVDGEPISRQDFAELMNVTLSEDLARRLTYFELLTSLAFQWFTRRRCDVVVLETGLGGRLDATNVIGAPLASVITSIDFDHTQFLGRTLRSIASEKAGIIKAGRPALCGPMAPEALAVMRARAEEVGARLSVVKPWRIAAVDWRRGRQTLLEGRKRRTLSLLGERQGVNAALARAALDSAGLEVSPAAWREGLANARWPGRFEVIFSPKKGHVAVLDGAHNPQASKALAETWKRSPWSRGSARWIIGLMSDKDAAGVLSPLAPFLKDVVCVAPRSPRALEAGRLAEAVRAAAPRAEVRVAPSPKAALDEWRGAPAGPKAAVVCGAFYLVGEAREILGAPRDA